MIKSVIVKHIKKWPYGVIFYSGARDETAFGIAERRLGNKNASIFVSLGSYRYRTAFSSHLLKRQLLIINLNLGARDETRTHNPVKEADFKSAAYTNSATRAGTVIVEVRTRVALVYAVLQTAA